MNSKTPFSRSITAAVTGAGITLMISTAMIQTAAAAYVQTYSPLGCHAKNPAHESEIERGPRGLENMSTTKRITVVCALDDQYHNELTINVCGDTFDYFHFGVSLAVDPTTSADQRGKIRYIRSHPHWVFVNSESIEELGKKFNTWTAETSDPLADVDPTQHRQYAGSHYFVRVRCVAEMVSYVPSIHITLPPRAVFTHLQYGAGRDGD